ncbi:MAG: tetratricopeptide repeat protein [Chthoniobacter sp.]
MRLHSPLLFFTLAAFLAVARVEADEATLAAFTHAGELVQAGNFAEAIAEYNMLLGKYPGVAGAYHNRGIARRGVGDLPGGIADVTHALSLEPKSTDFLRTRATMWHEAGKPAEALADLDQVLEIDPQDAAATHLRGVVKMEKGDSQGAAEDFTHTLELVPDFPRPRQSLRRPLRPSAISMVRSAMRTAPCSSIPNPSAPYLRRGLIKRASGFLEPAVADFTRVLQLDPRNFGALYERGRAYSGLGREQRRPR